MLSDNFSKDGIPYLLKHLLKNHDYDSYLLAQRALDIAQSDDLQFIKRLPLGLRIIFIDSFRANDVDGLARQLIDCHRDALIKIN
jgi:hypothetical protein